MMDPPNRLRHPIFVQPVENGLAVGSGALGIGIGQGHGAPHVPFLVGRAQRGVGIELGAGYQNQPDALGLEILRQCHVLVVGP